MYKVLVADGFAKKGIEKFLEEGFEVKEIKEPSQEQIIQEIPDYDVFLVRGKTKPTKEIIEAGKKGKLKMIGRSGAGVDGIDIRAATDLGVIVKYSPHGGTRSVSEFATGLIIASARNIPQSHYSLKQGIWNKKKFEGIEINKKTIGIVGCGRIGRTSASILEGYEPEVIGYDPYVKKEDLSFRLVDKDELLEKSDFIVLHAPKQSSPILGHEEFKKMAKKPYIIDVSRWGNLLEDAVYDALKNNLIKGYATDVWPKDGSENQEFKSRFFEFENFIGTPHLGASTKEGQMKTSVEMAEVTISYLLEGDLTNAVNAGEGKYVEKKKTHNLFVTHENVPGMFGRISDVFGKYNNNLLAPEPADLFYNWKEPATKTTTCFRAMQPLTQELIDDVSKIEKVYSVQL